MIIVYGEILIDLNKNKDNNSFDYFVGGAPFNVAYSINKTGGDVKFIGNVGFDLLGKYIKDFVKRSNMDDSYISLDDKRNTTLAFVFNEKSGERSFCFARKNGADYYLKQEYLDKISEGDIVHIGSLMLSEEYGFNYAKEIIKIAKKEKKVISFDINYRDDIFKSKSEAIEKYKSIYKDCDIVKVSNDELFLFTQEEDLYKSIEKFSCKNQKIFVTLGKEGSLLYYNKNFIKVSSINISPVDTTGAGDAFFGTILSFIDQVGYDNFFNDEDKIKEILYLANIQGAYATLKKGALDGVLSKNELINKTKIINDCF